MAFIPPSPNQSLLASVPISVAIVGAVISVALVASLKAAYVSSHKARAWGLETSSHLSMLFSITGVRPVEESPFILSTKKAMIQVTDS